MQVLCASHVHVQIIVCSLLIDIQSHVEICVEGYREL